MHLPGENGTTVLGGVVFELLKKISHELNFEYYYLSNVYHISVLKFLLRYTIEEPADGAWGIYSNGSWNGMIGMLQRKVKKKLICICYRKKVSDNVL